MNDTQLHQTALNQAGSKQAAGTTTPASRRFVPAPSFFVGGEIDESPLVGVTVPIELPATPGVRPVPVVRRWCGVLEHETDQDWRIFAFSTSTFFSARSYQPSLQPHLSVCGVVDHPPVLFLWCTDTVLGPVLSPRLLCCM